MKSIRIANRRVGEGNPSYIIAEAGSNHDGKLSQALRLIDVAARCGADAVKFQTFRLEWLYPDIEIPVKGTPKSLYKILSGLDMPRSWIQPLAERARKRGVDFLSTPFDEGTADWLNPYVPAFKIASSEINHFPLLKKIAKLKKPVILSTGGAGPNEVDKAVETLRRNGCRELVLLHCVASYPAPLALLNLRSIEFLRKKTGGLVGFSDHSEEPADAPCLAVALGACVIEKHITLDKKLPGPDHSYALNPRQFKEMVEAVRKTEAILGRTVKTPLKIEQGSVDFGQRTVFSLTQIKMGDRLTIKNTRVLRRAGLKPGISPFFYEKLIGRRAQRDIPPLRPIQKNDIQG